VPCRLCTSAVGGASAEENLLNPRTHKKLPLIEYGCVFADFVRVQWVVQVDCPETHQTYTHRVGRTARMDTSGQSLLLLRPAEETAMIAQLTAAKIPLKKER
jgi:hypothetical protein